MPGIFYKLRSAVLAVGFIAIAMPPLAAQELTRAIFTLSHPTVAVGEDVFLYVVPKRLGYFRKEGLDITLRTTAGVPVAAQALQGGAAHFATTSAEMILALREQGGDLLAFHNIKRNMGWSVAVLQDSPIRQLEDLKGKTIGSLQWTSLSGPVLIESLSRLGIGLNDYKRVNSGAGPASAAALRSKQVDALSLWDSMYASMERAGLQLRYIDVPLYRRLGGYSVATTEKYANANPQVVEGFCRAINAGIHFTRTNPAAAMRILVEDYPSLQPANMDVETIVKELTFVMDRYMGNAMEGLSPSAKTGDIPTDVWDFVARFYRERGVLKGTVPASSGYTTRFFEACNAFDREAVASQARQFKN